MAVYSSSGGMHVEKAMKKVSVAVKQGKTKTVKKAASKKKKSSGY